MVDGLNRRCEQMRSCFLFLLSKNYYYRKGDVVTNSNLREIYRPNRLVL